MHPSKKNNSENRKSSRISSGQSDPPTRKRKAASQYRRKGPNLPPALGCPGILLTCDTGREVKCEREGLQILEFYFKQSRNGGTTTKQWQSRDNNNASVTVPDTTAVGGSPVLSLDQELEQLRQAASRGNRPVQSSPSPFAVCDTGCRGTVLILCNTKSPATQEDATTGTTKKKVKTEVDHTQAAASTTAVPIRMAETEDVSSKSDTKRLLNDPQSEDVTLAQGGPTDECTAYTWDPLDTVYSIVQDMKQANNSLSSTATVATVPGARSMIPSSRYITRMIPMQATCTAKQDALEETVRLVLKPIFVQQQRHHHHHQPPPPPTQQQQQHQQLQKEEKNVVLNSRQQNADKETENDESGKSKVTTFAIQPKRRNCSHLTRKGMIDTVANVIDEYCGTFRVAPAWKADLSNPDYSIVVEVCRNMCGVSVVPRLHAQQAKHYNIADIRSQTNNDNDDPSDDRREE